MTDERRGSINGPLSDHPQVSAQGDDMAAASRRITESVRESYSEGVHSSYADHAYAEFDAWLQQIKATAWDEGAGKASPHGGGYLRSILIQNPYRDLTGPR